MKSIESEKLTLLANNRSIADYNLQREPKLRSARELLAETYKNAVQIQKLAESNRFKLGKRTRDINLCLAFRCVACLD